MEPGRKPIRHRWVFTTKCNKDGIVQRFKARLVVRGFSQQHRVDYNETYALMLKFETFRTLLAIAAVEDLELHQMNIKNVYLASELEEQDLYMQVPEGLKVEGKVCKLNKDLYDLKQASRVWNKVIKKTLSGMKFYSIDRDSNVFVNSERNVIIALYVDDLLLLSRLLKEIEEVKAVLA